MMNMDTIRSEILAFEPYVIEKRRKVHTLAEVGGYEWDTRALIEKELTAEGIPFEELEGTGVIGILDTGRPGPHVALRADIDALPMPESEENLKGPRTCRSRTPESSAHMCGHDAHTAMLLGTMKIMSKHRDELNGIYYFCFEQGEENNTGWKAMINGLKKYDIDVCWGQHVAAQLPTGYYICDAGPRLAGNQFIDFTFIGKGGHGSRPDQAVNPVFCGANFYNNIAVAFANQIDANETVTLGLTAIKGGEVGNVIPDKAQILGSLRFFNMEEGEKAVRILHEVAENTAAMHHCTVDWSAMQEIGMPTINDDKYTAIARKGLIHAFGEDHIISTPRDFGSESFSRYSMIAPSVFGFLGVGNPDAGSGAGAHTSRFDLDEAALKGGVLATLSVVMAIEAEVK